MISAPTLRFDCFLQFQERLGHFSPGSPEYEEADIACRLALNPRRSTEPAEFFSRNLRRDARRTFVRQPNQPVTFSSLKDPQKDDGDAACEVASPKRSSCRPIDEAIALELLSRLSQRVGHIPGALRCLDGMLTNESVKDTATAMVVSERRVHHVRGLIRKAYQDMTCRDETSDS
ncbi:hypothetical protein Pla22_37270 [Rubripirellula amarantea]|uniref:Uncharacterized protein n=1 Tax=Rubripirellula amarantea TaxID=2527999 RepID=A0A5C5WLX2_9BACT|nr:hypothetical protein [Rubripirellula amarantea]TWT50983.1 hypothetical protein Pla22_37270 [Rubripirellula amarantea]